MRVSTGMIYDSGLAGMQSRTSALLRSQQQISSGRRILAPSDDPVAAARALEVTQSLQANKAQAVTRDSAKNALGIAEGHLQSATDLLGRVRELTVQAGDAALSASDRKSIALELRQRFDELVAIANAKDGIGNSLFGGFQVGNKPFAGSVEDGVAYTGDDGIRALQVSNSRQLGISLPGNDIFMRLMSGNGVFATATQNDKSVNATHITYEGTSVLTNPPATTGSFELKFWTDTVGGNAPSPAQSIGTVDLGALAYPYAFGVGDQFSVAIDGALPVTVTLNPPASFNNAAEIVTALQAAIGATGTVNLDTKGQLTFTSASSGATSGLAFANVTGTPLTVLMGGVPANATGAMGAASATYYDLVDSVGISLFTGTASTTGGAGNTYTHAYTSGTPFALDSSGPLAFDYGASVIFTGIPGDGDSFSVDRTTTAINIVEKAITENSARATIDAGVVSDPLKWGRAANSGNLEVRFWVDAVGTVATSGQAVGSISPTLPLTITAATNDQFAITIDGGAAQTATILPGTYTTTAQIQAAVQLAITNALPVDPGTATVTLDANGSLVVTSNATGAASTIALAEGNGALAATFGVPAAPTPGTAATAGRTFYDLVDATTGNSLFTSTASTTGPGGTYTHPYASGTQINLASPGGGVGQVTFDFGANVTVSGIPAGGDVFTLKASQEYSGNGHFVTAAKTQAAYNTGSGIIGTGDILDEAKWNHPANSRNLEVRFWKDPEDLRTPQTIYYDLVDAETEKSLFTNAASTAGGASNSYTHTFKPGDAVPFSGLAVPYGLDMITDFGTSVTIDGEPASGDAFKVEASQSQSIFTTLAKTIQTLEGGKPVGTIGNVQLANELGGVLTSLGRAEQSISSARAVFGSALSEVDNLDSVGESLGLQFEDTLARLQDLDYADAITKLTRQQMELQAAQQSFSKVSQLSLFDYIR